MSEKRFSYEKECYRDEWYGYVGTYIDKEKGQYIEVPYNTVKPLVDTIMEQKATIEMYQRRVDKREEQISTIKRCCLRFLNDEQIQIIEKELGYE